MSLRREQFIYDRFTDDYRKSIKFETWREYYYGQDVFTKRIALEYAAIKLRSANEEISELKRQIEELKKKQHYKLNL